VILTDELRHRVRSGRFEPGFVDESVRGVADREERLLTRIDSKLYAIVDVDVCRANKLPVAEFAQAVCAARPRYVQLRAKRATARETLELLDAIVPIAHRYGVLVFANDRADLALLARTDGVHVGQEDLPIDLVRSIGPALRMGLSTHNETQLQAALLAAPDYVAYGPVYSTTSKANADSPVGIADLVMAARLARAAQIPLVAIGGISLERLREVAPHADFIAMIGALVPSSGRIEDVTAHVARINAELAG
jgi:thiamine-phosphate pyrophosphorylase